MHIPKTIAFLLIVIVTVLGFTITIHLASFNSELKYGCISFNPPISSASSLFEESFVSLAVADLNNDTSKDIIVGYALSNTIDVFLNDSYGYFQPARSQAVFQPAGLHAYDFTRDGFADLVRGNLFPSAAGQSIAEFFKGNGDGTFTSIQTLVVTPDPVAIDSADFNNDTHQDIVLVGDSQGAFHVRLWNPQNQLFNTTGVDIFLPQQDHHDLWDVAVADFDGDTSPDITFANRGPRNTHFIFFNDGAGNFSNSKMYELTIPSPQQESTGVTTGDFNGDKRIDIATANMKTNDITILFNQLPNQGFTYTKIPTIGITPYDISTGDVEKDGDVDFVVSTPGSNSINLFINDGTGNFQIRNIVSPSPEPSALVIENFNRADTMPDVAVVLEKNQPYRLAVHPNLMWHKTDFNFNNKVGAIDMQIITNRWQMRVGDNLYDRIYEVAPLGPNGIIDIPDIQKTAADLGWDAQNNAYAYPEPMILLGTKP